MTFFLAASVCAALAAPSGLCIPPDSDIATTKLISDPGFDVTIEDPAGAMAFESISIDRSVATFTLERPSTIAGEDPAVLARVFLRPRDNAETGDEKSANFAVGKELIDNSATVAAATARAVKSILAHDDPEYFQPCNQTPRVHRESGGDDGSGVGTDSSGGGFGAKSAWLAIGLLLAAGIANFVSGRRRKSATSSDDSD